MRVQKIQCNNSHHVATYLRRQSLNNKDTILAMQLTPNCNFTLNGASKGHTEQVNALMVIN